MSDESIIFSPEFQDAFWKNLDPDIRGFLDTYEQKEDWTYSFDELPDFFIELSRALPRFATIPPNEETKKILRELIPLLAAMPLRQAVSAIAWLDNHIVDEGDIGWGVIIYLEAAEIYNNHKEDEIHLFAKIIYERIRVMLTSTLSSMLFSNIQTWGDRT